MMEKEWKEHAIKEENERLRQKKIMHIKPNFKVLVQNVYQNYDLGPLREVEGDGADSWESISHRINCRKVSASS